MNLIPTSIITMRWYAALNRLRTGKLYFVAPNGDRSVFGGLEPGPEAEFAISSWDVIRNVAARGDVALGEDYIAARWTTPDVEALFSVFLLNMHAFEGFSDGNLFHRSLLALHNRVVRRNSRKGSARNIRAHYDVGNAFYSLWLDETMTYSSALDTAQAPALAQAQRRKYGRILERIEHDGGTVLEIGSGWGGFAEEAVRNNRKVTGLTVSPAQHAFSKARLGDAADIRLQDYRDIRGTFDNIVSIEMFEAVGERYWPTYFGQVSSLLKRGGKAMVQTITVGDELFPHYRTRSDFIRHYVFPGGMLPSLARFREEAAKAGLKINDVLSFGKDYAHTLRVWSRNLKAKRSEVLALGYDEPFLRNWEYYLGMCAAAFEVNRTDVVQVELAHAA